MQRFLLVFIVSTLIPGSASAQLSSENFSLDVSSIGTTEFGAATSETFTVTNAPDVELQVAPSVGGEIESDNGSRLLGRRETAATTTGTTTYVYVPSTPPPSVTDESRNASPSEMQPPTDSGGGNAASAINAVPSSSSTTPSATSAPSAIPSTPHVSPTEEIDTPAAARQTPSSPPLRITAYIPYSIIIGGSFILLVFLLFWFRRGRDGTTE